MRLIHALLASTCLLAPLAHADEPAALAPLLDSMAERLAIADQVALSKWDSGKAVEDRPREQDVIASAVRLAPEYNVAPAWAEQFFSAQIEANKLVQYEHLADWTLAGAAPALARPDLVGEIRPALDRLQHTLLKQLADFAPYRDAPGCNQWLAAHIQGMAKSTERRVALTRASAELCASGR